MTLGNQDRELRRTDDQVLADMRAVVAATVRDGGSRLRSLSAPALVAALSASALAPICAVAGGAGVLLVAGAGVLGSIGANVLTEVLNDAIAGLRGRPNAEEQVQRTVASRVERAFRDGPPEDQVLRTEIVELFQAVDIAGVAFRTAVDAHDDDLVKHLSRALSEVAVSFAEFAFVLAASRLALEDLREDVRREVARQSVDREHARRSEADIARILDAVRGIQPAFPVLAEELRSEPRWQGCPYRGLPAFAEAHAAVFYGRRLLTEQLIARLGECLADPRLLLVLGPSGAGKSSVLSAGLMAALADDQVAPGCRDWPRRMITPTADPLRNLAAHLADLAGIDALTVYDRLSSHPEHADLLAAQIVNGAEGRRLVLVLDQFEELFTLVDDPEQRTAFVTALDALLTGDALVVAAIRGDFIDLAMQFPCVRTAAEGGLVPVTAMSESELRDAIVGPALEAGREIPHTLTAAVLDDLRQSTTLGFDSGTLPLLSQVMFVMWQAGDGRDMTVEHYRRTGGIADILHTSAERAYAGLEDCQRVTARRVFVHLVNPAEGRLTRRPATVTSLRIAAGCPSTELETVLEAFTTQRLIVRDDDGQVSVAHEVLLESWSRLRDWLQPSLADRALHQALVDDVEEWHSRDRNSDYLYRGEQLVVVRRAAERWATTDDVTLAQHATEFLTASERHERRGRRTARAVMATVSALLILAIGTAVVAAQNSSRATQQGALALSRQLAAQSLAAERTSHREALHLAAAALRLATTEEAATSAGTLLSQYYDTIAPSEKVDYQAMAWGPTARLLALGFGDKVQMWNPVSSKPIGPLLSIPGAAHDPGQYQPMQLAFSPDGRRLAVALGHTVTFWDPTDGTRTGPTLSSDEVTHIVFRPDGREIAVATAAGSLQLWNLNDGRMAGPRISVPGSFLEAVAIHPNGNLLTASAGTHDALLRRWDLKTGAVLASRRLPAAGLRGTVFLHDGRLLATRQQTTIQIRDSLTGAAAGPPLSVDPVATALSPDGRRLATSQADGTVQLWNWRSGKLIASSRPGRLNSAMTAAFSPDGKTLATAGADATVHLWNPTTAQPISAALNGHSDTVHSLGFSAIGDRLASGSADGTFRQWDPATRRSLGRAIGGFDSPVYSLAYRPDGRLLVTGSSEETIRTWDPASGRPVEKRRSGPIEAFAFDGDELVAVDGGRIQRRSSLSAIDNGSGNVYVGGLSDRGRFLAAVNEDGTARVWDTVSGRMVAQHGGMLGLLAISPDGRILAIGADDGSVRFWDRLADKVIGGKHPTQGRMSGPAVFSPDGRFLAAAGQDNLIRLWDSRTGDPVGAPMIGTTEDVSTIAISADGRRLASSDGNTIRLWDVALYTDPLRAICEQVGGITRDEWRKYAVDQPFVDTCAGRR